MNFHLICSSFPCNSIPCSGCSALYIVNLNKKNARAFNKSNKYGASQAEVLDTFKAFDKDWDAAHFYKLKS